VTGGIGRFQGARGQATVDTLPGKGNRAMITLSLLRKPAARCCGTCGKICGPIWAARSAADALVRVPWGDLVSLLAGPCPDGLASHVEAWAVLGLRAGGTHGQAATFTRPG
jgi:hypothetical protein